MDDDHLPSTLKERCALHSELPVRESGGTCGCVQRRAKFCVVSFHTLVELKLDRQQHPHLHGVFAPARRFEEPFFHRLGGGKIELTEAG